MTDEKCIRDIASKAYRRGWCRVVVAQNLLLLEMYTRFALVSAFTNIRTLASTTDSI